MKTENLAFIITGDITAQWLRDTGNQVPYSVPFESRVVLMNFGEQFAHYHTLLSVDKDLQTLVKAVINNEGRCSFRFITRFCSVSASVFPARYISQYPYCGAFQPPPESGLSPSHNSYADGVIVNPPVNNQTVFECKYEIDSLCSFIKLSRSYYQATNDNSIMNDNCMSVLS